MELKHDPTEEELQHMYLDLKEIIERHGFDVQNSTSALFGMAIIVFKSAGLDSQAFGFFLDQLKNAYDGLKKNDG